ncbi:MAG: hypothetical protein K0S46_2209 [Moraxellaceae bacterium]|jgi:hypothetical protein|nr:hypothetical protein [Moraxellaceae bacterium]
MAALNGIDGVDGWGDFTSSIRSVVKKVVAPGVSVGNLKRKTGLNKLGTRKQVKAAVNANLKIVGANIAPTKKNAKAAAIATSKSAIAKAAIEKGGNMLLPGAGSLITAAADNVAAKDQNSQIRNAVSDAAQQMQTLTAKEVRQAKAEAEAEAAAEGAAVAAPAPERKWSSYVLWGSVGLGAVALLLKMRNGGERG